MWSSARTVAAGDTIIVWLTRDQLQPLVVTPGKDLNTKFGNFRQADLVGVPYGSKVPARTGKGFIHVLRPTPELWTLALPHRTQILYLADIAFITAALHVRSGSRVVEAGTGSASFSHSIARTIGPTGRLFSFEFHEARYLKAREEFARHRMDDVVTLQHRNVCKEGFGGVEGVDAVFLDLPAPWEAVGHAKEAMRKDRVARICCFSPCIEQVLRTVNALNEAGFTEITMFETLLRPIEVFQTPALASVSELSAQLKQAEVKREEKRQRQIAANKKALAEAREAKEAKERKEKEGVKEEGKEGEGEGKVKVNVKEEEEEGMEVEIMVKIEEGRKEEGGKRKRKGEEEEEKIKEEVDPEPEHKRAKVEGGAAGGKVGAPSSASASASAPAPSAATASTSTSTSITVIASTSTSTSTAAAASPEPKRKSRTMKTATRSVDAFGVIHGPGSPPPDPALKQRQYEEVQRQFAEQDRRWDQEDAENDEEWEGPLWMAGALGLQAEPAQPRRMNVAKALAEVRGHTSYLTFASLVPVPAGFAGVGAVGKASTPAAADAASTDATPAPAESTTAATTAMTAGAKTMVTEAGEAGATGSSKAAHAAPETEKATVVS